VIAVRSDTVEMPNQKVAELLHLGQPLPPQCLQPAKEKSGNIFSGPVRPEPIQLFAEENQNIIFVMIVKG
jgi:hypothetical protein